MPEATGSSSVSDALLQSIKTGTQPNPESIASGDLGPVTLKSLAQQLQQAQEDLRDDIRTISKDSAPDVDRWILEAKQLRADVRQSEEHANKIKTVVIAGTKLRDTARDAQNKVGFLSNELDFHTALLATLEKIQTLNNIIEEAREATIKHKIKDAVQLLQKAQFSLSRIPECRQTGLLSLLQARIAETYHGLSTMTSTYWERVIFWNKEDHSLRIREVCHSTLHSTHMDLSTYDPSQLIHSDDIIFVLEALGALRGKLIVMKNEAQKVFFRPRLRSKQSIKISGPYMMYGSDRPDSDVNVVVTEISGMLNFFDLTTRTAMTPQLMEVLAPDVISELIEGPLTESVPPDLSGIPKLSETLNIVTKFSQAVKARKWPGHTALDEWVSNAPKIWLQSRSDGTLNSVRQVLSRGLGRSRAVEKVETQKVSSTDDVFNGQNPQNDWDASWSDNEEGQVKDADSDVKVAKSSGEKGEDEDGSDDAWGFDEDDDAGVAEPRPSEPNQSQAAASEDEDEDDDADEAWGWGEDNAESDQPQPPQGKSSKDHNHAESAKGGNEKSTEREVTLRETYYVSSIPEQILEMIVQIVDDAQTLLSSDESTTGPIKPAGKGLMSLPSDVLAMFRACAPTAYESDAAGNFYIYNDSQYLAEQLRAFSTHYSQKESSKVYPLALDADIDALEAFGKRAYGREMEAQRTILRDLLDGAQGFTQCTQEPFAEQCELAIASVADRLHTLHAQWHDVAAPSALLQSLGSLYGTVVNKIVLDVCDLSDISEPESRRLVELCGKLEDPQLLFLQERDEEAEITEEVRAQAAMAASVYTPSLLRFQWLAQILEGSLADIKYWWNDSELSLAFEAAEVVDLIEALFADSDHRRKAIVEVRRAR